MDFDVRYQDFTFKHTYSEKPDLSAERYRGHIHTTYEFLYFVQGNADFMLKHTLYKLRPGSLLIVKPGEYHNIVFHSDAPYDRYVIRFPSLAICPYARKQLERAESVYYIDGTPLSAEFLRLDSHVPLIQDDVLLSAMLGSLNVIIAYLISSQNLIQKADYINENVRIIVEYIDQHLSEIHSADEIAHALHMSKSALYKSFSQQFDSSLMSYIRTQKCMAAQELINEGVLATTAAERLGFNHYSSFYRDYTRVFGFAPSTKRQQ